MIKQEGYKGSHTIDLLHIRFVYMYLLYYCILTIKQIVYYVKNTSLLLYGAFHNVLRD
jgi:hypothetical protein